MILKDVIIARIRNDDLTDKFQKELEEFCEGLEYSYSISIYYDYDSVKVRVSNDIGKSWSEEDHNRFTNKFGLKLVYFEESNKETQAVRSSYVLFEYVAKDDENTGEMKYNELRFHL